MHINHIENPISERLKRLLSSGRIPHLLIFVSPDADLLSEVARAFILDWLRVDWPTSLHPDFLELKRSGKAGLHSVANIRKTAETLHLAPYGSLGKAVLIEHGDRMFPAASNMLLKLLEEPPDRSLIVLTTSASHRLLPTIRSRGQIIRIPAAPQEELHGHLVELFERSWPSYDQIVESAALLHEELEEKAESLQSEVGEDLSASAKKEIGLENEAEKALWLQEQAKTILEGLYLHLRNRPDPSFHVELLQKALDGIDRGGNLKTMLPWFLSQVRS